MVQTLAFFLIFVVPFVESRFEDIIEPHTYRQYSNFKNINLTYDFQELVNLRTNEFYEFLTFELPPILNVTSECLDDIVMIGLVLTNKSSTPGFDKIVAQSEKISLRSR